MRSILIIIASLFVAGLMACGEDTNSPAGPADLSQWCDFERPRQNCTLEEGFIVHEVADIQAICNSPCTELQQVTFEGEGGRALAGLHGWTKVDYLSINTNEQGPENLVGLETLEQVDWLEISNTRSIKNLVGLTNLKVLGDPTSDPLMGFHGLEISDSGGFESLEGLDSLQTIQTLAITHSPVSSLAPIAGVEIGVSIDLTFTNLRSIDSVVIKDPNFLAIQATNNNELTSIPALSEVKHVGRAVILESNPKLPQCEIEAFVDGLETRPEDRRIRVTNNKPCP